MCEITSEDSKSFHNNISNNVRFFRKEKLMTQLDVSLDLGFNNPSFVTNAESINSNKKFNLTQLHKLSVILNINICEFFKIREV